MHKLPESFEELISTILPEETRLKEAQHLTEGLRKALAQSDEILTTTPHTRLIGSYACSTAISSERDMKDIDFLVFLKPDYLEEEPSAVLRELKNAIQKHDTIDRVELTNQRRSINVWFKDHDFHLDVVPALIPDGVDSPVQVPDRIQQKWIRSHPLGFVRSLSELNQEHSKRVSPLIRLLKHWRDVHMKILRPKSYWLSSLIYSAVSRDEIPISGRSYAEIVRDLFAYIQVEFSPVLEKGDAVPSIKDPMLGTELTIGHWTCREFETFMKRIDEAVGWTNRALADDISREEAIRLWQKVFGDKWFPACEELSKEATTINSAGQVGFGVAIKGESIPIPRHRFYGQG